MTGRERVLAALNRKPSDVVPFDLGGTKVTSLNVVPEEKLEAFLGVSAPVVWGSYIFQRVHMPEAVSRLLDVDVRRVGVLYPAPLPPASLTSPVQVDIWGIEWRQSPVGTFLPANAPLGNAQTADDFKNYPWPDPISWQPADELAEQARNRRQEADCAICIDLPDGIVQFSQWLRGPEQWLIDTAIDRKLADLLLGYLTDIYVEMVSNVMAAVGDNADLVLIPDDLGGQQDTLIDPHVYREMIKPRHARIFEAVKRNSSAKVVFHTCGSVYSILGDLVDVGIDGLNPVQVSAAKMDTKRLKREFGDELCFWGAIDTQHILPFGTPDDVREEVRRRIEDLANGGGYVIAPVHIVQPEVPLRNLLAMIEAAHVYGNRSDGSQFHIEGGKEEALQ